MADTNKDEEYERMLEQAISQISVYSDEWTNRLPSDPGITILENLTAFLLLLLQKIHSIPEETRCVLPELLGVHRREGACARVLLGAYDSAGLRTFSKHEKFYLGNLCFETDRDIHLPKGRMRKVYREHQGQFEEIEELKAGNPLAAPIFGERPQAGDAVYLLFDGPYAQEGEEVKLYVNAQPAFTRNPPDAGYPMVFAEARWSYSTEEGYAEAECADETNVFLESGELGIRLGASPPALGSVMGVKGYLLKCELLREEYDQIPYVKQIEGPLFEVREMDSKAVSYEVSLKDSRKFLEKMQAKCSNDNDKYLFAYIGNNKDGYRAYQENGRDIYKIEDCAENRMMLAQHAKVVYMEKEMAVQKLLGTLYGYDSQEFELGIPGEAVPDSLEIMAEKDIGGEKRSFFFSPLQSGIGDVRYEYDSGKKVIRILDAGDFEGAIVSISGYAIYHGEEGNVLPENCFFRPGAGEEVYRNPVRGQGGRMRESQEETVERMRKELLLPGALVTAADYELLVRLVPGLCIHKAKAIQGEGGRDIQLFVKPYGAEELPGLPRLYVRQIQKYLEGRRLLGTKIHISGPEYIAVDVHAVIAVKIQYAAAQEEIEKAIRQELDDVSKGEEFCNIVSRQKVLRALERLPCIDYVQDLSISQSGNRKAGIKMSGMDIRLPKGSLCYAGNMELILKRSSMI